MAVQRVCVYCASSQQASSVYHEVATRLGVLLAEASVSIVYGGGGTGSMGALADGALSRGGRVIGIIPEFMRELEWSHAEVCEMLVVDDLRERKRLMLDGVDACIALPGGCGTLEELLECITLKRLGIFVKPIVMINVRGFFDPLLELLESCVREKFMDSRHLDMWRVVQEPHDVLSAIENAPPWSSSARAFASLK
jgi:uncharacterized protein (TIGR00730 family)